MPSGRTRRAGKQLTAAMVRSAQEPGKYHDGSGTGLYLRIDPNGARFWVQRTTIHGKRREIGLGSAEFVSLAEARDKAFENKRLALSGGDPIAEKRKSKAVLNFEEASRRAHEEIAPTLKNLKDRKAFLSTLETYIFPRFGHVSVADVTSADIRQAILDVRNKRPEVARKLKYRILAVFRWAVAEGLRPDNPATSDALALKPQKRNQKHFVSLPYTEVARCIEAVRSSAAMPATKLALEFLVLTAKRSGEVRGAVWDEIRLGDELTWDIPPSRIKMEKTHRVPLAPRAIEILREAEQHSDGSDLVFPGARQGRPLSDMTLSKLVRELGFDVHVHGFRTSFRTWSQERTTFPREVAEAALAHKIEDQVEAAYARSDYFEKRRMMMNQWAAYLEAQRGEIVQFESA